MIKIVLTIEYDGRRYHGFQLQAKEPTIQGELERALQKLTGERIRVIAASRTDAGVHARGQVIGFKTSSSLPTRAFIYGLNYYLPRDIAVKEVHQVDERFNVRRGAIRREYSYFILNRPTRSPLWEGFAYHLSGRLDIEAMNQACAALLGEHDFASFASSLEERIKNTRRRIYEVSVRREGELVIFNIAANSFLPHQVRNTVGALLKVGLGKMSLEEFYSIMEKKKPGLAGPAVPACGLYLERVVYPKPFGESDENL